MAWDHRIANRAVDDRDKDGLVSGHFLAEKTRDCGCSEWERRLLLVAAGQIRMVFGDKNRFGIVQFDFETLKLTPKASYHALQAALAR